MMLTIVPPEDIAPDTCNVAVRPPDTVAISASTELNPVITVSADVYVVSPVRVGRYGSRNDGYRRPFRQYDVARA
jgi:hypothetical protein